MRNAGEGAKTSILFLLVLFVTYPALGAPGTGLERLAGVLKRVGSPPHQFCDNVSPGDSSSAPPPDVLKWFERFCDSHPFSERLDLRGKDFRSEPYQYSVNNPEGHRNAVTNIRKALEKNSAFGDSSPGVRTVLYPLSGHDASLPFELFNNPSVAIGIDAHPFLLGDTNLKESQRVYWPMPAPDYGINYPIDWFNVGGLAISRLAGNVPSFRLRRVVVCKTGEDISKELGAKPGTIPTAHGLIEFDSGPGTRTRHFIHINQFLGNSAADKRLLANVEPFSPNAVLIQAALELFISDDPGSAPRGADLPCGLRDPPAAVVAAT